MTAEISPLSVASTVTAPTEANAEFAIEASVSIPMTLLATAPPPATDTPAAPPTLIDTDAVAALAVMSALLSAVTETAPPFVDSEPTPVMKAATGSSMLLSATEMPIETATPAAPPMPAASAAASTSELMAEVSCAPTVRPPESIVPPVIELEILTEMSLTAAAPAPATPTPAAPPPAIAAEPAAVSDWIVSRPSASTSTPPAAVIAESKM